METLEDIVNYERVSSSKSKSKEKQTENDKITKGETSLKNVQESDDTKMPKKSYLSSKDSKTLIDEELETKNPAGASEPKSFIPQEPYGTAMLNYEPSKKLGSETNAASTPLGELNSSHASRSQIVPKVSNHKVANVLESKGKQQDVLRTQSNAKVGAPINLLQIDLKDLPQKFESKPSPSAHENLSTFRDFKSATLEEPQGVSSYLKSAEEQSQTIPSNSKITSKISLVPTIVFPIAIPIPFNLPHFKTKVTTPEQVKSPRPHSPVTPEKSEDHPRHSQVTSENLEEPSTPLRSTPEKSNISIAVSQVILETLETGPVNSEEPEIPRANLHNPPEKREASQERLYISPKLSETAKIKPEPPSFIKTNTNHKSAPHYPPGQSATLLNINTKPSRKIVAINSTQSQIKYRPKVDTWNRHDASNKRIKENLIIKQRIFESRDLLLKKSTSKNRPQSAVVKRPRVEIPERPSTSTAIQLIRTIKAKSVPQAQSLKTKPSPPPPPPKRKEIKPSASVLAPVPSVSFVSKHSIAKTPTSSTTDRSDTISINTEDITFEVDDDYIQRLDNPPSANKDTSKSSLLVPEITFNKDLLLPESKTRMETRSLAITTKSFKSTDWTQPYEILTIEKCLYFILPDHLKSSRETLKCVKFSNLTSYRNIETVLRNCPNIKKLTFSNIIVVHKKKFKPDPNDQIELANLKSLEILQWNRRITKYDYWILYLFNFGINCSSLESFTLQGVDYLPNNKSTIKSKLKNVLDPNAVLNILLNHRTTLRRVSVGGVGFQMLGSSAKLNHGLGRSLQDLNQLQLTSIRAAASTDHVGALLLSQQRIQNLVITGTLETFEPDLKALIYTCLRKNKETMVSFTLSPCVVSDDVFKIHYGKVYNLDCEVFRDFRRLKNLVMNVAISPHLLTQKHACGKIFNIQTLPYTLVTIELYHEEFFTEDLTTFASNLSKYANLSKIVLSASKTHPYYIHLAWVKSLVKLKHLRRADFYSGKLEDFQGICEYMLSKPKGFITMTTLADRVSFCRACFMDSRRPNLFHGFSASTVTKSSKSNK